MALFASTSEDEGGGGKACCAISTMHAAKGLEWACVFLPGLEEGTLPHSRSQGEAAALAEERRLLYVAMTRAKLYLQLSFATARFLYGEHRSARMSSFLSEVGEGGGGVEVGGRGRFWRWAERLDPSF